MVHSEEDYIRRRLSKAEEELNIVRPERDKLKQLLSQAEEELVIVRSQKDTLRQLLSEAESENLQRKLAYVDLKNDYERERMKRINLVSLCTFFVQRLSTIFEQEKRMDPHTQSPSSRPSAVSLKCRETIDEILVEDDVEVSRVFGR